MSEQNMNHRPTATDDGALRKALELYFENHERGMSHAPGCGFWALPGPGCDCGVDAIQPALATTPIPAEPKDQAMELVRRMRVQLNYCRAGLPVNANTSGIDKVLAESKAFLEGQPTANADAGKGEDWKRGALAGATAAFEAWEAYSDGDYAEASIPTSPEGVVAALTENSTPASLPTQGDAVRVALEEIDEANNNGGMCYSDKLHRAVEILKAALSAPTKTGGE